IFIAQLPRAFCQRRIFFQSFLTRLATQTPVKDQATRIIIEEKLWGIFLKLFAPNYLIAHHVVQLESHLSTQGLLFRQSLLIGDLQTVASFLFGFFVGRVSYVATNHHEAPILSGSVFRQLSQLIRQAVNRIKYDETVIDRRQSGKVGDGMSVFRYNRATKS